MILDIENPLSH